MYLQNVKKRNCVSREKTISFLMVKSRVDVISTVLGSTGLSVQQDLYSSTRLQKK